jgi:hypothetical protein
MSVIGLFTVKGSPGATTLALALAAHGRSRHGAVLIEADTAGGDLALRYGIAQQPGLAQLAARTRHAGDRRGVLDGLVRTINTEAAAPVHLVPAPVEPAAVEAAVTALHANPEVLAAAGRGRTVLLDLGRLDAASPGFGLIESCDLAVLVVRGNAVSLGHAREAAWVADLPVRCGFVLIDTGPYRVGEVAEALAMDCLGVIPAVVRRPPLRGRRATRAVRALWTGLTTPIREPATARDLVEVQR